MARGAEFSQVPLDLGLGLLLASDAFGGYPALGEEEGEKDPFDWHGGCCSAYSVYQSSSPPVAERVQSEVLWRTYT